MYNFRDFFKSLCIVYKFLNKIFYRCTNHYNNIFVQNLIINNIFDFIFMNSNKTIQG